MKHTLLIYTLAAMLGAGSATATAAAAPGRDYDAGKAKTEKLSGKPAGNSFVVSWRLILDSLKLRPNGMMVFTPIVEDTQGNTAMLQSILITGRKQHYIYLREGNKKYPNAKEFRRDNGKVQGYYFRDAIPLEEWMKEATVRIHRDTCGCGDLLASADDPRIPVNPHLERRFVQAFLPPVTSEEPVLTLQGKAYLDYPVNRTELYPDYHDNPAELNKIMKTIDTVRNNANVTITRIDIHGYASPEGPYDNNIRLSIGRAATLKEYVRRQYDFPADIYHVRNTPEDWAGLDSFLVNSNVPEKDEILKIVRSDMEPDARNEKIKKTFPEAYRFILATWYPYLRHSDYTVAYQVRPMSDREAEKLLQTDPRLLSLNRMFRIANLHEVGSKEYNEVMAIAVGIYPNDPVANVNAANVALRQNDLVAARRYLSKAGNSREAVHARGVLALLEGKYAEARPLLEEAARLGVTAAGENIKLLDEQEKGIHD